MKRTQFVAVGVAVGAILGLTGAASAQDWNGFYAGIHGSYVPSDGAPFDLGKAGLGGGAQAGYNMQLGPGVIGVELEADKTFRGDAALDQQAQLSAKARAGLALGSTLIFATAGYGTAYLGTGGDVAEGWHGGLLLGGGVEQKLTDQLSVRLTYEQLRLGDVKLAAGGTIDTTTHSVKTGVNFAF